MEIPFTCFLFRLLSFARPTRAGSQLLAINNYYQKRELAIAMIALVTLRLSFANELEWITSLDYYKVERHGISGYIHSSQGFLESTRSSRQSI